MGVSHGYRSHSMAPSNDPRLVEFTIVVLLACFPILPRLFQSFRKPKQDSRYQYERGPYKKPSVVRKNEPVSEWYGNSGEIGMGPYVPLEVEKPCPRSNFSVDHARPKSPPHRDPYGIRKDIEIDMVRS